MHSLVLNSRFSWLVRPWGTNKSHLAMFSSSSNMEDNIALASRQRMYKHQVTNLHVYKCSLLIYKWTLSLSSQYLINKSHFQYFLIIIFWANILIPDKRIVGRQRSSPGKSGTLFAFRLGFLSFSWGFSIWQSEKTNSIFKLH